MTQSTLVASESGLSHVSVMIEDVPQQPDERGVKSYWCDHVSDFV